jgi:hypothetical protein
MVKRLGQFWTGARLTQWYLRAFVRNSLRNWWLQRRIQQRVRHFPASAERLLDPFRNSGAAPPAEAYEGLFRYIAQGWRVFRTERGEGANYPGLPSWSGSRMDEMEGFARIMPLFGAWVASGRPPRVSMPDGSEMDLVEEFRRGLVAGTDPSPSVGWGRVDDPKQKIVEAADVALALWLFRDTVWQTLTGAQQAAVAEWLGQVNDQQVLDNNWHLFVVVVDRVLDALGHPVARSTARAHFERIKDFQVGSGWFKDGPAGHVDFYNAWGFHYLLYWIDRIDPSWDPAYIRQTQRDFLAGYKHVIGPRGFPILGRSVCYRMAVAAPFVFGQRSHPDVVTAGEARRALDCVWQYFIQRGAVRRGTVTQGYCGKPDPRLLDPYSGPSSCLWSLRSLVAALELPGSSDFWSAAPEPLPVERGDFELRLDGVGWVVRGSRDDLSICIEVPANAAEPEPVPEPYGVREHFFSVAEASPRRPKNYRFKFGQRHYRSDRPYCGCS